MSIMVSIIVTTHNRKKLLKRAIKSVLSQSYQNFELIIVDDCSTDGTHEAIKKLEREYPDKVRAFKTETNSGHDGYPKNLAVKEAKGDYICFLDDDDEFRIDAVKILHKYISHTQADVVYGDYMLNRNGKNDRGWSVDYNIGQLQQRNYISMCVAIIKKSKFIEIGGFNEEIPKFKDWNLWLRLSKVGALFFHIPIIVSNVYVQEDSISTKYENKQFFNPADCKIYADKTCLGEPKEIKVAVFTLTWDRLEYTKRMYKAMKELSGYDFDWFVIDQGSTDGTREYVNGKVKSKIFYDSNVGIAKGWNDAIDLIKQHGEYDLVIKIDNDAEMLSENWLKDMVSIYERNVNVILSPYVEGLEDSPGGVLRQRGGQDPYVMINDKVLGFVPYLGGIVWAAPMRLYKDFKFPEGIQGNKDYFISQYAVGLGYHLFYMEELRVSHIEGTKGQKEKYPEYFKRYA